MKLIALFTPATIKQLLLDCFITTPLGSTKYCDKAASSAILEHFRGINHDLVWRSSGSKLMNGEWRMWNKNHWASIDEQQLYEFIMDKTLLESELAKRHADQLLDNMRAKASVAWDTFNNKEISVFDNTAMTIENHQLKAVPFNKEDYITIPIPYPIKSIPIPKWQALIDRMLPNIEDRQTLQEMYGYCMFPSLRKQVWFLMRGVKNAGKSTLVTILGDLVGDSKSESRISGVKLSELADPHRTYELEGKLINHDSESHPPDRITKEAEGILKGLTGNDKMSINPKGRDSYSVYLPTKFIMSCNTFPIFSNDEALWDRMVVIPFDVPLQDTKMDEAQVRQYYRSEYPGIIAWALEGVQRILDTKTNRANAFTQSERSKQLKKENRTEGCPFLTWYEECVRPTTDPHGTSKEDAFRCYQEWCQNNGQHPKGKIMFGREMRDVMGLETIKPPHPSGDLNATRKEHWKHIAISNVKPTTSPYRYRTGNLN